MKVIDRGHETARDRVTGRGTCCRCWYVTCYIHTWAQKGFGFSEWPVVWLSGGRWHPLAIILTGSVCQPADTVWAIQSGKNMEAEMSGVWAELSESEVRGRQWLWKEPCRDLGRKPAGGWLAGRQVMSMERQELTKCTMKRSDSEQPQHVGVVLQVSCVVIEWR